MAPTRWLPGQTKTIGRPAIGDARPNPLGGMHEMDNEGTNKKAEKTGIYVVKGDTGTEAHMRFKEGDILPAGAVPRNDNFEGKVDGEDRPKSPRQAERERIAGMTEERALTAAPENRAAKGTVAPKDDK